MTVRRWGFLIGPLTVCWRDEWTSSFGLEITWRRRNFVNWGFRG